MNDPEHFPEPSKFSPERYLEVENISREIKFKPNPRGALTNYVCIIWPSEGIKIRVCQ